MIDYEAAINELWEQFIDKDRIYDAAKVVDAALGDEPLYRRATVSEASVDNHDTAGPFVQIWPNDKGTLIQG